MVASCLELPETGGLRNCLIEKTWEMRNEPCAPKVQLVTDPLCGGCADAINNLQELIDQGKVAVLDSNNPAAYNVIEDLGQHSELSLPALVIIDCEGHMLAELSINPEEE